MPIYLYSNGKKTIEITQSMNEVHEYIDADGLKWERVFTVPNATVDSSDNLDINDPHKFSDFTKQKKGTVGDMWKLSQELSDKRVEKYGEDKVKDAYQNRKDNKKKNRNKFLLKKKFKVKE